jgi:hypothetical protein
MVQNHEKRWGQLSMMQLAALALLVGFALLGGAMWRAAGLLGWFILLAPFLILGYFIDNWKCPRCGNQFHRRGKYGWTLIYRTKCANCGLPRGQDPS